MDRESDFLSLANTATYYEDSSESLTIDDVLAPNFGVNFIEHDADILHFGITSSAYWVRFDLDWSTLDHTESKILEFGPRNLLLVSLGAI
tara:strand:+ start:268 stop:537 length:270 start_codon:yes stop_codon:yes gene_type:complete